MKVAAIDIGANSVHLVVARLHAPGVRETLDRSREMIRLGDGTFRTGSIPPSQMRHAMALLRRFRTLSEEHRVEAVLAVATSAVRDAKNRGEFVRRAEKEASLAVRVLSGEEEARLIYLGVREAVPPILRRIAVIDIGGGSVEVAIGEGTEIIRSCCLKLGSLRMAVELERRGRRGLKALEELVRSELLPSAKAVALARVDAVIGTSGTILAIAELLGVRDEGRPIRRGLLEDLSKKLLRAKPEENAGLPAVGPKRADTIGPGSLVLRVFMEAAGLDAILPCEQALREGVVADYARRHPKGLDLPLEEASLPCRRSVLVLARRLGSHDLHARQTVKLALRLFDDLTKLHGLGRRDRELLEYAALLHDAGYWISSEGHHKHAFYLIRKAALAGFSAEEVLIVALVARYHRGAFPRRRHEGFGDLSHRDRERVRRLAALLRIADGLDRSRAGLIRDVDSQVRNGKVVLEIDPAGDPELEIIAALRRGDLFRRVFDLDLEVHAGRNGKP
jgi:exopolyphosphatase/guanosine-5'-triphosphate,3'-diphosphate pyrophosphatase